MEFRNINTFLCVVKTQSFTKAAEKLGYSQSNVSFQIQQLEQELGIRLFERMGRSICLTEPGREFLFYANELSRLSEQALSAARSPEGRSSAALRGLLRIGSIGSIAAAFLPDLLAGFHRAYPKIQITVYTESRDTLTDRVKKNEIDLFFDLNQRTAAPDLACRILREEEIVFLSAKTFPIGNRKKIPLRELAEEDFVLTERGESYRSELDRLLAERSLTITPIIEFGNPETIIRLLKRGLGLSFLPLFCARDEIRAGRLSVLPVDAPKVHMYSQVLYHKNKWITPQMEALLSFTADYFIPPHEFPLW